MQNLSRTSLSSFVDMPVLITVRDTMFTVVYLSMVLPFWSTMKKACGRNWNGTASGKDVGSPFSSADTSFPSLSYTSSLFVFHGPFCSIYTDNVPFTSGSSVM